MSKVEEGTKIRVIGEVPGYGTPPWAGGEVVGTVIKSGATDQYLNYWGTDDEFAVKLADFPETWYYYREAHEGIVWERVNEDEEENA